MPPVVAAAAITAGSAIVGGAMQSSAANKAAKASQQATEQSLALQREQYEQTRSDQQPYMQAGYGAVDALQSELGLGGGQAGAADWNAYINDNHDVRAIQDILEGKAQGTPDQLNFIEDFKRSGKANIGEYHASVVPGRPVPTTAAAPTAAAQPRYQAPAYTAPTRPDAPTYTAPEAYQAPTRPTDPSYTAPTRADVAALDVSLDSFKASPDYNFRVAEGQKNLLAYLSAKGMSQSGGAMRKALELGQNLADSEYTDWRTHTTDQYRYNTDRTDQNFENDRTFGRNVFSQDRSRGDSVFSEDRQFGFNQYTDNRDFERAVYDTDLNRSDTNFNADRAFGRGQYEDDRNFGYGQSRDRTDDLFRLTGVGQSAASGTAAAGSSYANNSGNLLTGNAENQGQAAVGGANARASAIAGAGNALGSIINRTGTRYNTTTSELQGLY